MANFIEYVFEDYREGVECLANIKCIANYYARITVADVNDICGVKSCLTDRKMGWTKNALENTTVEKCDSGTYIICMPKYDWYKETADIQPEPINVTITVDKLYKKPDIIEQTIQALFNDPEKIKDRPVFITIM